MNERLSDDNKRIHNRDRNSYVCVIDTDDDESENEIPLHDATFRDDVKLVVSLLEKGESPNAANNKGHTPLHIAAKKNKIAIATLLLEYEADPNAKSKEGFTPLHFAAKKGHARIVHLLIGYNADVNLAAKNGFTPLHVCAQEDKLNVATVLVQNGARLNARADRLTPYQVAIKCNRFNMMKFLYQFEEESYATLSRLENNAVTSNSETKKVNEELGKNERCIHKSESNSDTDVKYTDKDKRKDEMLEKIDETSKSESTKMNGEFPEDNRGIHNSDSNSDIGKTDPDKDKRKYENIGLGIRPRPVPPDEQRQKDLADFYERFSRATRESSGGKFSSLSAKEKAMYSCSKKPFESGSVCIIS